MKPGKTVNIATPDEEKDGNNDKFFITEIVSDNPYSNYRYFECERKVVIGSPFNQVVAFARWIDHADKVCNVPPMNSWRFKEFIVHRDGSWLLLFEHL